MLTLHTAARVATGDGALIDRGAVAVSGDRIVHIGPLAGARALHPAARVREWPGLLGPARVHTGPLPVAPSPREIVHALLKTGATAVLADRVGADPALRSAAARADVRLVASAVRTPLTVGARADFSVLDGPECVATVCAGRLVHRRR
ncbi:hypothetical protein [Streptomyces sp. NPDC007088]|uniref:hypothetical protein n=1 Tax=Streptomyces sp. NPDC007088 TaxID=3364773 RepID=UPI0036BC9C4F